MKAESLESVFYVSSTGEVYAPIPRDHALVKDVSNKEKPGFYTLTLYEDPAVPKIDKNHILRVFFAKTNIEGFFLPMELEKKGWVSAGPYPREVADSKIAEIGQYGREVGQSFVLVLEKVP